jgi:hypothetical protein
VLLLRSSPSASGRRSGIARRGRGIADCPEVPEEDATPPRADPREQALPWDMRILRQTGVVRPGRADWDGGGVCGKDAADCFEHGSTTSATAGSRIACGNCDAGRRRSVNASAGRNRRDGRSTPRRNAGGAPRRAGRRGATRPPRPPPRRLRILRSVHGHAATGIRKFSAIGPAVTSPREMHAMRAIAARRARRPCGRRRTVNGSGCGATATWADSNATWSTKRRAPNAAKPLRPRIAPPRVRRGPRDRKVRS